MAVSDRTTPGVERLSEREIDVLQRRASGPGSARDIATDLGITYATLRTHQQNILTKLHVHSIGEAIAQALREGLIR